MAEQIRIALWSGPRNLSTTMMRSFGARADTTCVDEPFYAAYLAATGFDHPMRDEILAAGQVNPAVVAESLSTSLADAPIQYQKQMTHHLLQDFPRGWMNACRHAFLIRHPARVLASFRAKYDRVDLDAIGFPQQWAIYQALIDQGQQPPVIDADDVLANPPAMLRALCNALDIAWDPAMLAWPAGPKPEDGPWAPHWYGSVWQSTGFGPPPGPLPPVAEDLKPILDVALPIYERMWEERLDGVARAAAQDGFCA